MSPHERGGKPTRRASHSPRAGGRAGSGGGNARRFIDHPEDVEEHGRYRSRRERNFNLPAPVVDELRAVAPDRTAAMLERRLVNAAQAYERDRYKEALQAVKPVVEMVPESAAARELYGLILYRLGRWRHAARELQTVHDLTGSFDQHPVIADCERALGHIDRVRQLWDELRHAGVDREVLVEGRLVMAGALRDAGDARAAIELLEPVRRVQRRNPDVPLLREWYALADLYETVGELPLARELFNRVTRHAPDLLDAQSRLRSIR